MQTIGKKGEEIATQYLKGKGYLLKAKNYRYKKSEIDLIFEYDGVLVFVEVKTRSSKKFGEPESFVSENQRNAIVRAAEEYLLAEDWKGDIRFDIVAIIMTSKTTEVEHLKDAFY